MKTRRLYVELFEDIFLRSSFLQGSPTILNHLCLSSPTSRQTHIYLGESWPSCFRKEVNWWWILTQWFCCKGEHRWRLEVGRFKMPFDEYPNPKVSMFCALFQTINTVLKSDKSILNSDSIKGGGGMRRHFPPVGGSSHHLPPAGWRK